MVRCPHCNHWVKLSDGFCPYCGTNLKRPTADLSSQNHSSTPQRPPHKKHHFVLGTLVVVILVAIGVGGAHFMTSNHSHAPQQSSSQTSPNRSNGSDNNSNSSHGGNLGTQNPHRSASHGFTAHQSKSAPHPTTPANKPGYTLATLPNNLQGTWYSYDNGKLDTLTITNNKIIENGQVTPIKSRPKNIDAMKASKHPQWGVAMIAPKAVRGIRLLNIRGWNQGAGDGTDFGLINIDGTVVLDEAGGAEAQTDANFFKSKQQAKQNKKKQFRGEKLFSN